MAGALSDDGEFSSDPQNAHQQQGCRIVPGTALDSPTPSEVDALNSTGGAAIISSALGVQDTVACATPADQEMTNQPLSSSWLELQASQSASSAGSLQEQVLSGSQLDQGVPSVPDVQEGTVDEDLHENQPTKPRGPKRSLRISGGEGLELTDNAAQREELSSTYLAVEPMEHVQAAKQNTVKSETPGTTVVPAEGHQQAQKPSETQVSSVMEDFEKLRKSLFGERQIENQFLSSEPEPKAPLPRVLVQMADLSIQVSMPLTPYSVEKPSSGSRKGCGPSMYGLAHGRTKNHRTAFGEPPPRSIIGRHSTNPVALPEFGDEAKVDHEQPLGSQQLSQQGTEAPPSPTISAACKESMQKAAGMPWSDAVLKDSHSSSGCSSTLPPVGTSSNPKPTTPRSRAGQKRSTDKSHLLERLCDSEDWQRRHLATPPSPRSPNGKTRQGKNSVKKGKPENDTGAEAASTVGGGTKLSSDLDDQVETEAGDLQTVVRSPGCAKMSPRPPPAPCNGTTSQQAAAARIACVRQHSKFHPKEHKPQDSNMPWKTLAMQEPPIRWQKYFEREKPQKDMMFSLRPGDLLYPTIGPKNF
eukprot:gnl/MRDRNA2_/MRDRNA2_112744_c0_seq1.p1 gnl/MRDRNA2_/MRDRNA2_112744_c0~~gnl/MRDRNA2_/MRDRNA2_112744_c0_seq1.p1  ORF type:complete len:585 (-),score=110.99 gnl/MRDRNA2_/MRDRNA2_112744_c0_seq1:30-1784(-)